MPKPDYFELLGLEKSMDIDIGKLTENYFVAQKTAHPDKSGESEQASLLNEAYGTLKNRFKRLAYLVGDKELKAPQELLMEIMELREEYEASSEKTGKQIDEQIEALFKSASVDYKEGNLDKVTEKYVRIKYLGNIKA